jgi:hypothetical protein
VSNYEVGICSLDGWLDLVMVKALNALTKLIHLNVLVEDLTDADGCMGGYPFWFCEYIL